jgi:hypothetical protein
MLNQGLQWIVRPAPRRVALVLMLWWLAFGWADVGRTAGGLTLRLMIDRKTNQTSVKYTGGGGDDYHVYEGNDAPDVLKVELATPEVFPLRGSSHSI